MKIELKSKLDRIPKSQTGDPAFESLGGVLTVFTPEEVCEIVNRWLYSAFYQLESHKKRAARLTAELGPAKQLCRQKFGISWSKATEEQQMWCVKEVMK